MSGAVDNSHLRHAALSAFDVQMINMLARTGGEQPWYPERNTAGKRELVIDLMNNLWRRNLIFICTSDGSLISTPLQPTASGRYFIRLTDEGRAVAAQLEAMQVAPKVEVVSA